MPPPSRRATAGCSRPLTAARAGLLDSRRFPLPAKQRRANSSRTGRRRDIRMHRALPKLRRTATRSQASQLGAKADSWQLRADTDRLAAPCYVTIRTVARIVFSTWGSLGDLHPYLALAVE